MALSGGLSPPLVQRITATTTTINRKATATMLFESSLALFFD